jgi:hypothetical protein
MGMSKARVSCKDKARKSRAAYLRSQSLSPAALSAPSRSELRRMLARAIENTPGLAQKLDLPSGKND